MTGPGRLAGAVIAMIDLYRHMISPLRPPSCRYMPTCSQYAVEALTQYGLIRGGWLAVKRLARCGPWRPGGWDPVPDRCDAGDRSDPVGRSEATREFIAPGRSEATRESRPQFRSANV